ncbi:MAG: PEP-CTERM sorting domain-containing protein [Planctomycetaceae bacterium]
MKHLVMTGVTLVLALCLAGAASAAVITPASYSYVPGNGPNDPSSLDSACTKLTNGIYGPFTEAQAQLGGDFETDTVRVIGWTEGATGHLIADFNLGGTCTVDSVTLHYVTYSPYWGYAPDSVTVSFSSDGLTYSGEQTLAGGWAANDQWWGGDNSGTVTLTGSPTANYVRVDIAIQSEPNGNSSLFLNEIQLDGTPIPEPVTMSLLALGGLAALIRRRRAS